MEPFNSIVGGASLGRAKKSPGRSKTQAKEHGGPKKIASTCHSAAPSLTGRAATQVLSRCGKPRLRARLLERNVYIKVCLGRRGSTKRPVASPWGEAKIDAAAATTRSPQPEYAAPTKTAQSGRRRIGAKAGQRSKIKRSEEYTYHTRSHLIHDFDP